MPISRTFDMWFRRAPSCWIDWSCAVQVDICSKFCADVSDCPEGMKTCESISDSGQVKLCLPGDPSLPAAEKPKFVAPKPKPLTDAGAPDGGGTDAGTPVVDAGTKTDAGTTVVDAGTTTDAGTTVTDAGTTVTDAGAKTDAGTTTDGGRPKIKFTIPSPKP